LGILSSNIEILLCLNALQCRKAPIALESKLAHTLDVLVELNVLILVDEPTASVSQMPIAEKPDESLPICIDPHVLNIALKREHCKLPALHATYFQN